MEKVDKSSQPRRRGPNQLHYHITRNGQTCYLSISRRSDAWRFIARMDRLDDPPAGWSVQRCRQMGCNHRLPRRWYFGDWMSRLYTLVYPGRRVPWRFRDWREDLERLVARG